MLALLGITEIHHDQAACGFSAGVLWHEVLGRGGEEGEATADLVGCVLDEVAIEASELFGGRAGVQDHAPVHDWADRMQAKLELGHHAEVPTGASNAPEE